ncbi:hypothetical protein [uncultured Enterovirga sp.]|uniref:hypothetical protein n=1 Tax=uncultured Enterovirga sp. TaxID=2026352 RepID=UPI0035C9C746
MFDLPFDARRVVQVGAGLALTALIGWGSFAYVALSSSQRLSAARAERDAVVAEMQQLQQKAGQLADMDAKLASARIDYTRANQGLSDVRTRITAAQQELAALNSKRAERSAGEKVSQTGSIQKPSEPPKRPTTPAEPRAQKPER